MSDDTRYTIDDIDTLIHPDDRAMFSETWRDALKGEEFDIGHRALINGRLLWLHTRAELQFNSEGKLRGFLGVFQDVTTQHHAATHLSELLDFSEKIVAESPVGIAVLDADGPCVLANEAFARMLGTTAANIRAINFRALPAWRNSGLFDAITETLGSGNPMRHIAHGATGFGRSAALEVDLAHIERQERPHILLIAKDISEFEAAATALREASRLAEEANRSKSEFLANMSHEIRTPMNAVIGLAQLALDQTAEPRLREYLTQMYSSANLLLRIINDILDYSKIEAGRLGIERQEFAVRDITARTIGMFRQSAGSKGLTLSTDIAVDVPPRIIGDPVRIGQIVINLAANAVKFTESGEVRLSIRRAPTIDQGQANGSDASDPQQTVLEFEVSDTGVGMDWMARKRLFEPFVQADGSITRQFGGTGLGLTISRRLARLMGGDISVQSEPGKGSQFTLQLLVDLPAPAKAADAIDIPMRDTLGDEPGGENLALLAQRALPLAGARILVVEDDPVNQTVICRLLGALGLSTAVAGNGREALERLHDESFAAVLMDLQMPEMDGLEATRSIRQDPALAALPVIAVSAAVLAWSVDACREAGMNDFIAKPIQPSLLLNALLRNLQPDTEINAATRNATGAENSSAMLTLALPRLIDLQERLTTNDFITVAELAELREMLKPGAGARAQRLEAAISRYDYAQARAILAELIQSAASLHTHS